MSLEHHLGARDWVPRRVSQRGAPDLGGVRLLAPDPSSSRLLCPLCPGPTPPSATGRVPLGGVGKAG